jgi:hypothetical protein
MSTRVAVHIADFRQQYKLARKEAKDTKDQETTLMSEYKRLGEMIINAVLWLYDALGLTRPPTPVGIPMKTPHIFHGALKIWLEVHKRCPSVPEEFRGQPQVLPR